jgi:hypothetical protein
MQNGRDRQGHEAMGWGLSFSFRNDELALMRGQMIAVEQASNMQNCGIQFQGQRPPGT